jgi:hypothetical protein
MDPFSRVFGCFRDADDLLEDCGLVSTHRQSRQGDRTTMTKFHDLEMKSITGEVLSFAQFKGRVCLVVNVASR